MVLRPARIRFEVAALPILLKFQEKKVGYVPGKKIRIQF